MMKNLDSSMQEYKKKLLGDIYLGFQLFIFSTLTFSLLSSQTQSRRKLTSSTKKENDEVWEKSKQKEKKTFTERMLTE